MRNMVSFAEILFRWDGFSDVLEGLRDDNASRAPWPHKAAVSRFELDRDPMGRAAAA